MTPRRTWGVAALLLAVGAGAAFYSMLWRLYAGQVLDYGSAPNTVGWFEGTVFYWFGVVFFHYVEQNTLGMN